MDLQILIKPDNVKLSDYGITAKEFSIALDVYNDGLESEFYRKPIDMKLTSNMSNLNKIDDIKDFPIITKSGEIILLSQLADIEIVGMPNQIKRLSGKRALTIQLRPHESISLEEAIYILENDLIKPIKKGLPKHISIELSGAASELDRTLHETKCFNCFICNFYIANNFNEIIFITFDCNDSCTRHCRRYN